MAAFRHALLLDPNYAPAVNGEGWAKFRRGVNGYEPVGPAVKEAEDSAVRAIGLDVNLADAYALLGAVRVLRFDWNGANEAGEKALKLDPTNASASLDRALIFQATRGSADAIVAIQQTLDRDPRNLLARRYAARIFYYAGRLTEGRTVAAADSSLQPQFLGDPL